MINQQTENHPTYNMALLVNDILEQLAGGADQVREDEDEEENIEEEEVLEAGEAVEEELGGEESFENVEVELIDGNKEGVVWLLINLVHIAYKQSVTKTTVKFQLSALAGEPHRPA